MRYQTAPRPVRSSRYRARSPSAASGLRLRRGPDVESAVRDGVRQLRTIPLRELLWCRQELPDGDGLRADDIGQRRIPHQLGPGGDALPERRLYRGRRQSHRPGDRTDEPDDHGCQGLVVVIPGHEPYEEHRGYRYRTGDEEHPLPVAAPVVIPDPPRQRAAKTRALASVHVGLGLLVAT